MAKSEGISKTVVNESKEKFEWLVAFMVWNDPFTHTILMQMNKRPTSTIPTLGVEVKDHGLTLNYNPAYFNSISGEEARYLFSHQVMHIVLHHCTRRKPSDPRRMPMYDVACDLAVNSLIDETAGVKAPKDALHPKMLGLPEKLSVEQYMDLLTDLMKPPPQPQGGKGMPGEEEEGEGESDGGESDEQSELREKIARGRSDDHTKWAENEIVEQTIRDTVEYIKNSNKWGSIGSDVQAIIEAAQRPQVNWRGLLRRFLGQIPAPTYAPTYRKPNRRFGYPYCGKKREHMDKALFAIDTSGSISDENLSQFLAELNKYVEQYPADLVLFDTQITYGPSSFSRKMPKFTFTGRGGTDVSDVLDLAEERGYKSVVFLTDGQFSTPRQPSCDVVWVITEDGTKPVEWGKHVQLVHKDGRKRK